jgi:UDP-N-acetylmuramate dehydrogenase
MLTRPIEIKDNVLLGPLTAYRIGGPAKYYARPKDREALEKILAWVRQEGLPLQVLGGGSNVLVSDRGFEGLILHIQGFRHHHHDPSPDGLWEVSAGTMLMEWVRRAARMGYAGAEALIGIPGTIGGGVRMNAGAYNVEISQLTRSVEVLRLDDASPNGRLTAERLPPEAIRFGYRESPGLEGTIILSAVFQLAPGDPEKSLKQLQEVIATRRGKQPLDWPSCGSVFRRPVGGYAGRLIEDAGLKGHVLGGAQVSRKHANFIINTGGATASDVLALIKLIKQQVKDSAGVDLQREVVLIGFTADEMAGT